MFQKATDFFAIHLLNSREVGRNATVVAIHIDGQIGGETGPQSTVCHAPV